MDFLMIVDDPQIAHYVSQHGVTRLFVDLEYMGKNERQKNPKSWKSTQTAKDVSKIRAAAPEAHVLVRVNPLHDGSKAEIDDVIARGADSVMLPMFHTVAELSRFFDLLNGRVEALPLVETNSALQAIPQMLEALPITGLHIGLNDLHLDLGHKFMFQPLAEGLLDTPCMALKQGHIPFGIGGLARACEGIVSPDFLLGEHVRLGSSAAILSQTFHRGAKTLAELQENMDFTAEIAKLNKIYDTFSKASASELKDNRKHLVNRINDVVQLISKQER